MENPFVYGKEVANEAFCNRKKEIAELLQDIESSQNVIIFSPRRYGKTSLIQEVLRLAERKGMVCIYIDLYSALSEADFARLLAKGVARSIRGPVEKVLGWFRDNLSKIRPKVVLEDNGEAGFTFSFDSSSAVIPDIEDILSAVHKNLTRAKKKGVIVFDEFQQIGQFQTDRLERELRSVIQRHRNISYIFMGSKKHLIYKMFSSPARPFYKSAKHFPITKIDRDEFLKFISKRFASTGKRFDMDIANEILDISDAHPYYTQFICSAAWEKVDKNGRVDIGNVLQTVLERESSAFQNMWDMLTTVQKQALIAISNKTEEDKIFSAAFLSRFGISSASVFQKTLKTLLEKDIIDKENGGWVVPDVLFNLWMKRSLSSTG